MDYKKLKWITIRDDFPLPCIDEALQVIRNCNWFTSFDLSQGYLQLVMVENDQKKTAFRVQSSGLYEFTWMPFGLPNAGYIFCWLMEQSLEDLWFLMMLLHLGDICGFALSIDPMVDQIERLWEFYPKTKSKKYFFFQAGIIFVGHVLSVEGISANPKMLTKWEPRQCQIMSKNSIYILAWHLIIFSLLIILHRLPSACMNWLVRLYQ